MSSYSMEIAAEQFSNFELVFRIRFTTESAKPQSSIVVFLNFRGEIAKFSELTRRGTSGNLLSRVPFVKSIRLQPRDMKLGSCNR